MKVTRIAYSQRFTAAKYARLEEIARRLGVLRSEIWNEYGSLKGVGLRHREIRDAWMKDDRTPDLPARLWKETLRDVITDIATYREAAKVKVRRAIHKRTEDQPVVERKRLYRALRRDEWKDDPFLRRQMRKHYKHGHTRVRNQIVLDTGCYKTFQHNGRAWIDAMSLQRGKRIAIPLNTTHEPSGTLRLILRGGRVEVHYSVDAEVACENRPCGSKEIGVDKGYTEVFTDSDGDVHGEGLGALLSAESDYLKTKYQRRNRLKAIAEASPPAKRARIETNNLGRKKLDARRKRHEANVKDKVYKAVHGVVDKANEIVAEDLTATIKSRKRRSKNTKRRLSGWVKGLIAVALQQVSQRRGASLVLVNPAYTSQVDHRHGILLGTRKGDRFHCFDGVVLQADENAAQNIKARRGDREISLWTSYREVKTILLRRTELWRERQRLGLLNQDFSCVPIPF